MIKDYYLCGEINLTEEKEFAKFINDTQNNSNIKGINLYINSNGGEAYAGIGISDMICTSKIPITTICLSESMSMAFLIFISGSYRKCYPNSTFLYHELSQDGMDNQKITSYQCEINEDKRLQDIIDEKICNRTKIKHEVLDSFKNKNSDWYISAPEALKLRIVDEIIQS